MRPPDTCAAGVGTALEAGAIGVGVDVAASVAEVHAAVSAAVVRRWRKRRQNTPPTVPQQAKQWQLWT